MPGGRGGERQRVWTEERGTPTVSFCFAAGRRVPSLWFERSPARGLCPGTGQTSAQPRLQQGTSPMFLWGLRTYNAAKSKRNPYAEDELRNGLSSVRPFPGHGQWAGGKWPPPCPPDPFPAPPDPPPQQGRLCSEGSYTKQSCVPWGGDGATARSRSSRRLFPALPPSLTPSPLESTSSWGLDGRHPWVGSSPSPSPPGGLLSEVPPPQARCAW